MKRLAAISTLLLSFASFMAIPVVAQHGGGHAGGGGFSGHAGGSGFSGGYRSAPAAIAPRSGYAAARPGYARPSYPSQNRDAVSPRYFQGPGMQTTVGRSAGSQYRQPYHSPSEPENRRWNHGGVVYENSRGRRGGYIAPYYWGYPFGLGYYGDDSNYGYDNSLSYGSDQGYVQAYGQGDGSGYDQGPGPYYEPDQYNGFDPQAPAPDQLQGQIPYRIQGRDQAQNQWEDRTQVDGPEPGQYSNQILPGAPYRPDFAPQYAPNPNARPAARPAYRQSQSVPNEPAVTLVFRDHRPNQVIHNYLINGGTLTVWDEYAHDIPIADLNIEATRKLNRDKGIDLMLPNANF
jgi:hypothetical protein